MCHEICILTCIICFLRVFDDTRSRFCYVKVIVLLPSVLHFRSLELQKNNTQSTNCKALHLLNGVLLWRSFFETKQFLISFPKKSIKIGIFVLVLEVCIPRKICRHPWAYPNSLNYFFIQFASEFLWQHIFLKVLVITLTF